MAPSFLIVDDSPGFLEVACTLLGREGLAVVGVAATCPDALRRVDELRPDVVLVDIDLGADSGFDVARLIASTAAARVILISGYAEDDFADLIAESPAAGFIPKADLSAQAIHHVLGCPPGGRPAASLSG